MFSNSLMSSANETSNKSKIAWNKLIIQIDVLQLAESWNPNLVNDWMKSWKLRGKKEIDSLLVVKSDNNSNWFFY